ncbi:MAG: hypothetical protein ACFFB5_06445 [Promethearchaeota archaeon]
MLYESIMMVEKLKKHYMEEAWRAFWNLITKEEEQRKKDREKFNWDKWLERFRKR